MVFARNCCVATMFPREAELVSERTGRPERAKSVQHFDRSNGLDTALYKKYLTAIILLFCYSMYILSIILPVIPYNICIYLKKCHSPGYSMLLSIILPVIPCIYLKKCHSPGYSMLLSIILPVIPCIYLKKCHSPGYSMLLSIILPVIPCIYLKKCHSPGYSMLLSIILPVIPCIYFYNCLGSSTYIFSIILPVLGENILQIARDNTLPLLTYDQIQACFQSSALQLREIDIFLVAWEWLRQDPTNTHEEYVTPLISHIRFPLISPTDLVIKVCPQRSNFTVNSSVVYNFFWQICGGNSLIMIYDRFQIRYLISDYF